MRVESPDLTELELLKKQHSCHSDYRPVQWDYTVTLKWEIHFCSGFGTSENDTLIQMLYKLQQALKRGVKSRLCGTTDLNSNPGSVTCWLSWALFLPPILWSTIQNFFLFPSINQVLFHLQLADMFNVFAWNTLFVPFQLN